MNNRTNTSAAQYLYIKGDVVHQASAFGYIKAKEQFVSLKETNKGVEIYIVDFDEKDQSVKNQMGWTVLQKIAEDLEIRIIPTSSSAAQLFLRP